MDKRLGLTAETGEFCTIRQALALSEPQVLLANMEEGHCIVGLVGGRWH